MFQRLFVVFLYILNKTCSLEEDNEITTTTTERGPNTTEHWITEFSRIGYDVICKMQANGADCSTWKNKTTIPRYYYDLHMQSCVSFGYYECEPSFNNFLSLFECNEHCHAVGLKFITTNSPRIYCRLQPDFGQCHYYHPLYYFDITTRTCKGFAYSGCGGNNNRFANPQTCIAKCNPAVGTMD